MTTYKATSTRRTTSNSDAIDLADISYGRERLKTKIHEAVLRRFMTAQNTSGLTKAIVARRLNKRPEQVTRWLSAPGNWTLRTVSDLMTAIGLDPADIIDSQKAEKPNHAHALVGKFETEDGLDQLQKIVSLPDGTARNSWHATERRRTASIFSAGEPSTRGAQRRLTSGLVDNESVSRPSPKSLKELNDLREGQR